MKNLFKTSTILLLITLFVITSCKKEDVEGCTEGSALNFESTATLNDGSCIFAYDIAQGVWNMNPDCDEYTIPIIGTTISLNEQLPETIDVQGAGNNLLYIEIGETQVSGTIDNYGNLTVVKMRKH